MSMHKIPLSNLEKSGLQAHRLPIGEPSQMADVFRSGIKWALDNADKECCETKPKNLHSYGCTKPQVEQA